LVGTSKGWETRRIKYGSIGCSNPEQFKNNLSKSHIGYCPSKEQREKHSISFKKWWSKNKKSKLVLERNKKISNGRKGMKFTEEHKRKLRLAKKGKKQSKESIEIRRQSLIGHKVSKETRIKIRNAQLGKKVPESVGRKLSLALKGRKGHFHTEKTKQILRIKALKRAIRDGGPTYGINEKKLLDDLEKLFKYKIKRQFIVIGYVVDGYIPKLNLCIEIDESHHFNRYGVQNRNDFIRQERIEKALGCEFLRIKDI